MQKSLSARPNGRSSHFIAPSTANGCAYCYVPRRTGYANPITVFTTIDKITRTCAGTCAGTGSNSPSRIGPTRVDPHAWVYDIGGNGDCSVDALVSDDVADLVSTFRDLPTAKASSATRHPHQPGR